MQNWQLFVIPEDKNLQEVVNGFHVGMDRCRNGRWKLVALTKRRHSGWEGAVDAIGELNLPSFPKRHVLLVIDFDVDVEEPPYGYEGNPAGRRVKKIEERLEDMGLMGYRNRIHILGVCRQSEDLRRIPAKDWGMHAPERPSSYESIGQCLAKKCVSHDFGVWEASNALKVNCAELDQMRRTVCVNLTIPLSEEGQIQS